MFRSALLCGGSALAVAASLYGSQALAATASDTAADTAPSVGELVVVAEKREQSIESVPVAVTAFSAEQKELLGIQKVQDLSDFSPGLSWTDIDDRIYIRGIGRNSDNLNNTSGVAVYYNGVYYGANAAIELQRDTLFVGNTEVDNGPQNTLHGSNSDGGVIQFTSQRPTDTPYAEVRAEAANYNEYFGEAVISGPINDHLKFRIGGNYSQMTGGYFNNLDGPPQGGNLVLGGGGQTHYIEGQLEGHWDKFDIWGLVSTGDFAANTHGTANLGNFPDSPTETQDGLTPSGFYGLCGLPGVIGSANGAGCAGGPPIVPGSVKTLPVTANNFPGNNPANVNPRNFIEEFNGINDQQRNIQGTLNATWHGEGFDATYLGAYQQFHYILRIPNQYVGEMDSGVTQFQEEGPTGATAIGACEFVTGNVSGCNSPLTINPTPNYLIFDEYDQSTSHEVDFTSTTNSPFQWVGGLYFYHEHWNQPVNQFTTPDQPQMLAPYYATFLGDSCPGTDVICAAPANPSQAGSTENTEINYNSYAGFAQGSYKFNDQWKVSGAVRYTEDTKSGWQEWRVISFDSILSAPAYGGATPALDITNLAIAGATAAYPGAGPTTIQKGTGYAVRKLSADWGAPTGEVDVDWTPDRSFLAYAKYSRGYKSGGWSTYTLIANPEVNPEYVDAFEVGAKKTLGNKLTVNADAFYYNYYGEQVPVNEVNTVSGQSFAVLYNVPLVHNYGAELWGSYHPIDPLVFNLSYSYLSAKIVQAACLEDTTDPEAIQPGANRSGCKQTPGAPVVQNVVGQEIPGATPNKISFNTIYTWTFDPGKLSLSGSVIWKDATYDGIFNRAYTLQPPYDQVNLLLNWTDAKNRYNIILFCNNLLNSTGYDGAAGALLATSATGKEDILTSPFLTAPRTFGIQVQYRWQ
jgi:iron complex outermembrane receptor protein